MRQTSRTLLACSAVLVAAGVAFGAEDPPANPSGSILGWLLIFGAISFLVWIGLVSRRRQGGYMAKAEAQLDRGNEHMTRIEQKTDRMIELLESIDRKLSERP